MKRILLILWLFLPLAYGQTVIPGVVTCNGGFGVQVGNCPGLPSPASDVVTINPPSIPQGGTATLVSQVKMSDGSLNVFDTYSCNWVAANTSVAFIFASNVFPANTVMGVTPGTTLITCNDGNISGSATLTVTGAPAITTPNAATCGTPPCALTQGTIGTAYSYLLGASAGVPPYTWTISVGSLPGGLSLSSSGCGTAINCNIQGTPSGGAATTNFTIHVVDASSNAASLAVSLTTIASGCTPGPPTYPCTPSNVVTANPPKGSISSPSGLLVPFSGLSSNGQSTGTGGTGADGTLVSDPEPVANGNTSGLFHGALVRVTNYYSNCGVVNEPACPDNAPTHHTFAADLSGSYEVMRWNIDDSAFLVGESSSEQHYLYTWTPGNAATLALAFGGGPSWGLPWSNSKWGPVWSRVSNHKIYTTKSTDTTTLQSWQTNVTYPTLPTNTDFVNLSTFSNGAGCLSGVGAVAVSDPLNVSTGDTWISDAWSTSSSQNTARYAVSYNQTTATCYMWNTSNGNYTTCAASGHCTTRSPVICQNCGVGITNPGTFPIHNVKQSADGRYLLVGIGGGCDAGSTCYNGPASPYLFEVATGNVFVLCNASVGGLGTCGGHELAGTLNWVNNINTFQLAERLFSTPQTPTSFPSALPCSPQPGTDWHGGWQNDNSVDTLGFFGGYDSLTNTANYTFCMVNEYVIMFPPSANSTLATGTFKRVGHSFVSANACFNTQIQLAEISQTGKYALITSNMGGGLGCMNGQATGCTQSFTGGCSGLANRGDVFILTLR